ncbi:MAG: MFS transporter [Candidatus Hermodarchaeota archaeon]
MIIQKYLGIKELPVLAHSLLKKYLILVLLNSLILGASSTFFILYVIDKLGFLLAAVFMTIIMLVQTIIDYPSGSLGDWIGQRWVLAFSYVGYALSYLLLFTAQSFSSFISVALVFGLSNAQASGTLSSWLDNNYRKVIKDADSDRKVYGFSLSRISTLDRISLSTTYILGGVLATMFSRRFGFFGQGIFLLILVGLVLMLVKNVKIEEGEIVESGRKSTSIREYLAYLRGGIRFLFSSKTAFFFLIGLAIYDVTWYVYGNLILSPIYFGYSGSDSVTGVLRTIIFLNGVPLGIYLSNVSKKVSRRRFGQFLFLHLILFFPLLLILLYSIPPSDTFNLLGLIGIIILTNFLNSFLFRLAVVLRQRITVDLVPSENRNAIYSLLPTLSGLFVVPMLIIAGFQIETYGISAGIIVAFLVSVTGAILIFIGMHFLNSQKETTLKTTEVESIPTSG